MDGWGGEYGPHGAQASCDEIVILPHYWIHQSRVLSLQRESHKTCFSQAIAPQILRNMLNEPYCNLFQRFPIYKRAWS